MVRPCFAQCKSVSFVAWRSKSYQTVMTWQDSIESQPLTWMVLIRLWSLTCHSVIADVISNDLLIADQAMMWQIMCHMSNVELAWRRPGIPWFDGYLAWQVTCHNDVVSWRGLLLWWVDDVAVRDWSPDPWSIRLFWLGATCFRWLTDPDWLDHLCILGQLTPRQFWLAPSSWDAPDPSRVELSQFLELSQNARNVKKIPKNTTNKNKRKVYKII